MSSVQLSVVSDSASFIKKTAKEARILRPKVPWTNVISLAIPEVLVIEPKILGDQRGFFFEAFQAERSTGYGITRPFVQDNISRSANGVLRGLHLQNPKCQGKLLTVLRGSVLDVAVDVRLRQSDLRPTRKRRVKRREPPPDLDTRWLRARFPRSIRIGGHLLQMR